MLSSLLKSEGLTGIEINVDFSIFFSKSLYMSQFRVRFEGLSEKNNVRVGGNFSRLWQESERRVAGNGKTD